MIRVLLAGLAVLAVLVAADSSEGHLAYKGDPTTRAERHALQTKNLYHARYVCRHGRGPKVRVHCEAATGWLLREWRRTLPPAPWWIAAQIRAAEKIGAAGDRARTDPWPNCPDPYDHAGHSWIDTLACENRAYFEAHGNTPEAWLDSPGYYRCGLQFDPDWERPPPHGFGRLCP